jgi:tRNA threonylcarbamoyl adenosine modification protein (Sua5/YciO/YrdC/YwlC family)
MPAEIIKIQAPKIQDYKLQQIVEVLNKGGVILYPTDTVYSFGCLMNQPKAIERIIKIKNIKSGKQYLSCIFRDISQVSLFVRPISKEVFKVLKKYLPGPFTFILEANNTVNKSMQGRRSEIGIRIPDHYFTQQLLELINSPLISSSVKLEEVEAGYILEMADMIKKYKHLVDFIIDDGNIGIEPSTVVDCTSEEIEVLREGKGVFIL